MSFQSSLDERDALLGLWRGDEDSTGYAHEMLAARLAVLLRPTSEAEFLRQLWPGVEPDEVEAPLRRLALQGFRRWKRETPKAA